MTGSDHLANLMQTLNERLEAMGTIQPPYEQVVQEAMACLRNRGVSNLRREERNGVTHILGDLYVVTPADNIVVNLVVEPPHGQPQ